MTDFKKRIMFPALQKESLNQRKILKNLTILFICQKHALSGNCFGYFLDLQEYFVKLHCLRGGTREALELMLWMKAKLYFE
jgi:hypothetical protein